MIRSIIDEIAKKIAKSQDDFLVGCFVRHGVPEDQLIPLGKSGRARYVQKGNLKTYYVDDEPLFSVETYWEDDAETGGQVFVQKEVELNDIDPVQRRSHKRDFKKR